MLYPPLRAAQRSHNPDMWDCHRLHVDGDGAIAGLDADRFFSKVTDLGTRSEWHEADDMMYIAKHPFTCPSSRFLSTQGAIPVDEIGSQLHCAHDESGVPVPK
jgi:hypothetical protein